MLTLETKLSARRSASGIKNKQHHQQHNFQTFFSNIFPFSPQFILKEL